LPCSFFADDIMLLGTPVRLAHMAHRPHLNDREGRVTRALDQENKYGVTLGGCSTFVRARPCNIVPTTVDGFLELQNAVARDLIAYASNHAEPRRPIGTLSNGAANGPTRDLPVPCVLHLSEMGTATISSMSGETIARIVPVESSDTADVRLEVGCDTRVVHSAPNATFGFVNGPAWRFSWVYPRFHLGISEMDALLAHSSAVRANVGALRHFGQSTDDAQYLAQEGVLLTLDTKVVSFFWESTHFRIGVCALSAPHRLVYLAQSKRNAHLHRRPVLFGSAVHEGALVGIETSDGTNALLDDGRTVPCDGLEPTAATFVVTQIVIAFGLATKIIESKRLDASSSAVVAVLRDALVDSADEETRRLIGSQAYSESLVDSALVRHVTDASGAIDAFLANAEALALAASLMRHHPDVWITVDELEPVATLCCADASVTIAVAHADPAWGQSAVVRVQAKWSTDAHYRADNEANAATRRAQGKRPRRRRTKKRPPHTGREDAPGSETTGVEGPSPTADDTTMQSIIARLQTNSRADVDATI
tara:strand:- start:1049 stop:2659 length:1611 start_codon:yes stop_codon:yes gene_type:complete